MSHIEYKPETGLNRCSACSLLYRLYAQSKILFAMVRINMDFVTNAILYVYMFYVCEIYIEIKYVKTK